MADKKVRFGIEQVYYAMHDGEDGFGTPKPLLGAVALSIEAQGESSTFYADDGAYETFSANGGYTGELEIAFLDDDAAADLLGEVKDNAGGIYEDADAQPKSFALLFMTKGNINDKRYAFYSCKLSRPSMDANTTSDTVEPDTITLPFAAIPMSMEVGEETKNVVKYTVENSTTGTTAYKAWYTAVQTPQAAAA